MIGKKTCPSLLRGVRRNLSLWINQKGCERVNLGDQAQTPQKVYKVGKNVQTLSWLLDLVQRCNVVFR